MNEDKRTQIGLKFKPRAGLKTVRMSVLGTVRNGLKLTATNAIVKGHKAPIVIGKIIGVCKVCTKRQKNCEPLSTISQVAELC